jgi:hypothetical protein
MPLKRGGGNHMQLYDSRNGEYTDQEKERMRDYDDWVISSFEIYGEESTCKFHFPIEGVHKTDYCIRFVRNIRSDLIAPSFVKPKMDYLLTYQSKNDKSKFLNGLGYSINNPYELFRDICVNTERESIEFSKFSFGEMLVVAKTVLKGKLVKTVWKIEKNLTINFVTLIPGGDKQWKK